jgi:hypothetical protein
VICYSRDGLYHGAGGDSTMHFLFFVAVNGLTVLQADVIAVAAFVIAIVPLIEHSLFERKVFKVLDEWPAFLLTNALLISLPYYLLYNERVNSYLTSLDPRFTDPPRIAYSYTAVLTFTIVLAAIILTVRFAFNLWLNMNRRGIVGLVMLELCIIAFWPVVILLIVSSYVEVPNAMLAGLNSSQIAKNVCDYIFGLVTTALILSNLIYLLGMIIVKRKADVSLPG